MANIKKPRYAKAYGVKNNFYVDDIVYTTTFGKKNEGKLSKETDRDDNVKSLDDSNFSLRSKSNKLSVSSNEFSNKEIKINNPIDNKKSDIIGINDKYEEMFFGQSYSKKDNIHIQIAYNILDMNKIMSLYYYNIIYALKNMVRGADIDLDEDVIGNLKYNLSFSEYNPYRNTNPVFNYYEDIDLVKNNPKGFFLFEKYALSQYPYYPIFKKYKKLKKEILDNVEENERRRKENEEIKKENEKSKIYNFNLLRILSLVRQNIAHIKNDGKNELYNLSDSMDEELISIVNEKFNNDVMKLKKDFNENASRNLWIIFEICSSLNTSKTTSELFKDYYEFSILKESRNIGINIKKIREFVFDKYKMRRVPCDIRKKENDPIRPKINLIYDFLIYIYLKNNEDKIETNVAKLRATLSDEEKNIIYKDIAQDFINKTPKLLLYTSEQDLVTEKINISIDKDFKKELGDTISLDLSNYNIYSKLIYFLTYFLEPKEKNDLITSFINKLDNIQTLNDNYYEVANKNVEYLDGYSFFSDAGKISEELRVVKSLSHMEENSIKLSDSIYKDVLLSLGYEGISEEINSEIEKIKNNHQIRNFLSNNIIQSKRFKYAVKYSDPKKFRNFIKCEKLIKSILNELPEDQLNRYYYNFFDDGYAICIEDKINRMYKKLLEINYKDLFNDFNIIFKSKLENENNCEKEKMKSLLRLYYTVIYLTIKNLVNINSVFIIGFECFERDYAILNPNFEKDVYGNSCDEQLSLLDKTISFYKTKNKHKYNDLSKYYSEFKEITKIKKIFSGLRNNIMHLSSITNVTNYIDDVDLHMNDRSLIGNIVPVYYELYVYTLERLILDDENTQEDLKGKYLNCLIKYKTYNKDFLKIMLAPLAYNVARYKNLTIRDLFYDQFKIKEVNNEENTNN